MRIKTRLFIGFLIGFITFCSAQVETYNYKRALDNINDQWHKLTLPDAVFGKLNSNFSDIRIYGITVNKDTIQAPYFLNILSEENEFQPIPFEIINKTKDQNGFYYTFEVDDGVTMNQIMLNFDDLNFDWKINLQGSQNQKEWFTLLEDYRILSISNESTNYKFTRLDFPEAKYNYYRLFIKHNEQPQLQSAILYRHFIFPGTFNNYSIKNLKTVDNKQNKTTVIDLELMQPVSVSYLNIAISNSFDYYRPLKIEYKSDSVKTERGWKYNYRSIYNGTLNSLEPSNFKLSNTIAKDLRLTIFNGDNQPLDIGEVSAKGYKHQLIARFTEPADYMLVYGNKSARKPNYDISKFETKVPKDLKALKIGEEQVIVKPTEDKISALFENNYWLWGIIGIVILLLGGFTLKMLKKS